MFINIIDTYRFVVAICDENLIGKRFEEENSQLEIKENFYKGIKKSKEEILQLISKMSAEDATFNIVGEESVTTAIESGIVSEDSIKRIGNIPYAMVLL
ncbi:hypothetical protein B6U91_00940 [Candidatus Pacearchaeota archaeon ex4484_71]|nr:MAG: hypothetical protein B6U91_00940 [Candidatus Pacearchaeota archaeon ex4484_71]